LHVGAERLVVAVDLGQGGRRASAPRGEDAGQDRGTRKEVVHGITNLRAEQADPAALGTFVRGHWTIENSVHYVRDVTYREDASRARTGNAPAVLAAIRNIVTTALRLAGAVNIAAARRTAALRPRTVLRLFASLPIRDETPL
jgi:hypothetical protein